MFLDPMETQKRYRHIGMLVAERHEKRTGRSLLEDKELETFTNYFTEDICDRNVGLKKTVSGVCEDFRMNIEISSKEKLIEEIDHKFIEEFAHQLVTNLLYGYPVRFNYHRLPAEFNCNRLMEGLNDIR